MARKIAIPMLFLVGLIASAMSGVGRPALAADNPIVTENQQPGSSAWKLTLTADDVNGQIKGYGSATSLLQGGTFTLYVSVNPAQTYSIDVYRIGYYGGLGGRLRLHAGPINGTTQPVCPTDATTGMIACNWSAGYNFTIPADWTSGVYLAVLTNASNYQNYVNFVVRDGRPAAFLYQEGINTAEAYNNWPNDKLTGKSLYDYNSYGASTIAGTTRAVKVSFDRPFTGDGSGQFLSWELQLVRWLEHSGYDVTYSTDVDTHANGAELLNHKAFFSAGHDEYWSNEMYNAAQSARDAGVNLAFFGANAVYWQARYEASTAGVANRVLVCYKDATIDPVQGPLTTLRFRDTPVSRPEQGLIGIMYTSEVGGSSKNVSYVVTNSANWAYTSTSFHDGDAVPGIVGYEMDRYMSNYPGPTAISQTLLSQSPFTNTSNVADYANSSIYEAPSKAWVFASGTMSWSWALDNTRTTVQTDPRIQQTTANVLNGFLSGVPVVHDLKLTVPSTVTAGQAFSASVMAENDRGNPVASYSGTVHFATSDTSTGVVLPPDSPLSQGQGTFSVTLMGVGAQTLVVSDAANNLSTTANLTVNSPAPTRLAVTAPPTAVAGQAFTVTVAAQDSQGNTVPSYSGSVHFTTSDTTPGVVLPPDSTLPNGQGSFSVTLIRAGPQTLTVADAANNLSGTANLAVTAAPASRLALASGTTTSAAGSSFSFTVTALDPFGNTDASYAGTVHFTTSDPSPGMLPADSTLTNGQGTFSATLDTAGVQTISATDSATASVAGSLSVRITPLAASSLSLSVPDKAVVNQPFNVTVTLKDRFGNIATGYTGTVYFTTSDLLAMQLGKMPTDYAFRGADAGRHTFSASLVTPPSQTITVADTTNGNLSATSPPIMVSPI